MIIPEGSLVLGSPARVVKTLDLRDQQNIKSWAEKYVRNSRIFKERDFEPK
jgi:carbonic anhydrase/acetyltransferase-like protein (isoleucine patch superfamily)